MGVLLMYTDTKTHKPPILSIKGRERKHYRIGFGSCYTTGGHQMRVRNVFVIKEQSFIYPPWRSECSILAREQLATAERDLV